MRTGDCTTTPPEATTPGLLSVKPTGSGAAALPPDLAVAGKTRGAGTEIVVSLNGSKNFI
ncbi:MAG TPA: hypothetical protein VMW24_03090 [Sedimentisphaerales bacterium]|nr:hypothetical protein [Sedimentisphaerales bacterium]